MLEKGSCKCIEHAKFPEREILKMKWNVYSRKTLTVSIPTENINNKNSKSSFKK
jgi:hypothetical protein